MTTWDLIIALFYHVDEQLHDMPKHPEAHLWPSEIVRRAKLGFARQGQILTPEALARYRVPRVASEVVTSPAKRTQGGDGPQRASVKGLSPVMDVKCGCRRR